MPDTEILPTPVLAKREVRLQRRARSRSDPVLPMAKILHYALLGVLVLGGLYFLWVTPPSLNPMADKRAAEALALVQTHRALGYPTILQAMTEHVRSMKERRRGVRLGEWRVKQADGDLYEIRIQLRDEGEKGQWFEREFIWHAHLASKKVNAASLPADGVTPKEPEPESPAPQNVSPASGPTSG